MSSERSSETFAEWASSVSVVEMDDTICGAIIQRLKNRGVNRDESMSLCMEALNRVSVDRGLLVERLIDSLGTMANNGATANALKAHATVVYVIYFVEVADDLYVKHIAHTRN